MNEQQRKKKLVDVINLVDDELRLVIKATYAKERTTEERLAIADIIEAQGRLLDAQSRLEK
jgi:hypothetical protein